MKKHIPNQSTMHAFATELSSQLRAQVSKDKPLIIYLKGELGAGKTTLVKGIVAAFGHEGPVKSPTYTLVETYPFSNFTVQHFDLYRLNTPDELHFMGVEDLIAPNTICLIEWPEKAQGVLPEPDITIEIDMQSDGRLVRMSP